MTLKKRLILVFGISCCLFSISIANQVQENQTEDNETPKWVRNFGGDNWDDSKDVVESPDGGFVSVGTTHSNRPRRNNIYLVKTDDTGKLEWQVILRGKGRDFGYGITNSGDGGYIITGMSYSYSPDGSACNYMLKVDGSGNEVWYKTVNNYHGQGQCIRRTTDGGYIISGNNMPYPAVDISYAFLIKTDSDGQFKWYKEYSDVIQGSTSGKCVRQTKDGGYIIAGTNSECDGLLKAYVIKTDAQGETEWAKTFHECNVPKGYGIVESSNGGFLALAYTDCGKNTKGKIMLLKINESGEEIWRRFISIDYCTVLGKCIENTIDGGYIIAGTVSCPNFGSRSPHNVLLLKTNNDGIEEWHRIFGGDGRDTAAAVRQTSDGGFIISGQSSSNIRKNTDAYLIKTDANGNIK